MACFYVFFRNYSLFVVYLLMIFFSRSAIATPEMAAVINDKEPRHQVQLQRNPDNACTQCHKVDQQGLHGKHSVAINPNNQLPVTCRNCHGNITIDHRNGAKDAMRFNETDFPPQQQNSVCLTCHEPNDLRKSFWPHDVHVMKISCAACHQLHPATDPMQQLDEKGKVKLCVDCHKNLHQNKDKP